ncbi:DUF4833 domain-containing protein [Tenacibaculum piscium]|uniref:DUF4833 domain-containing protein n=1 Tax=Tenacibaculum piscium TaxID=1458515 RepID=UPI001F2BEC5B|nr:DUF4833 domain-containing protein [Tenacibaculum piscium]
MKKINTSFLLFLNYFLAVFLVFYSDTILAQENYPVPEKTKNLLFYIQHSNNYNTYLYDINRSEAFVNKEFPIKEYRILYAKDGSKKELTTLQKKLAYGVIIERLAVNLYKFRLVATDALFFYLTIDKAQNGHVYTMVNNRKMYVDKLFLQFEDTAFGKNIKTKYILFYGEDFQTRKKIVEKYRM